MKLLTGATGTIGKALQQEIHFDITASKPRDVPFSMLNDPCELAVLAHGPNPSGDHNVMSRDRLIFSQVISTINILESLWMRPKGLVVLFSSIAARKGSFDPSYAAAKGAISSLVPTYANKFPCRVVGIAPGLIEGSRVFANMEEEYRMRHRERMRDFVQVEDVVRLVRFLYETPSIHNTIIEIDGGYRL